MPKFVRCLSGIRRHPPAWHGRQVSIPTSQWTEVLLCPHRTVYLHGAGRAGYPSRRELRSSGDVAPGCVTPVAYAADIKIILLGEQPTHPCRQDILHDLDPDLQISASTSFSLGCRIIQNGARGRLVSVPALRDHNARASCP